MASPANVVVGAAVLIPVPEEFRPVPTESDLLSSLFGPQPEADLLPLESGLSSSGPGFLMLDPSGTSLPLLEK